MIAALAALGAALVTITGAAFLKREGNKKIRVLGVIPARYGSTRFPGKPLALLGGKPMVQHTYMNSKRASCLTKLVVATDDERIVEAVEGFGGEAIMTSVACKNGTERCYEVMRKLEDQGEYFDVIVNIQGDEPLIEGEHIDTVAAVVSPPSDAVMGTLVRPAIDKADVTPVNNVKAVLDVNNNALYFSRALIPHNKKGEFNPEHKYWRKLGIYSYKVSFLPKYLRMPSSLLQDAEDLEQNKVLEAGFRIKVGIVNKALHGVDTEEQLKHLDELLSSGEVSSEVFIGAQ